MEFAKSFVVYKFPEDYASDKKVAEVENVLQSRFVSSFVSATRAANRLQNDMDMVIGGLPKAFL